MGQKPVASAGMGGGLRAPLRLNRPKATTASAMTKTRSKPSHGIRRPDFTGFTDRMVTPDGVCPPNDF